MRLIPEVYYNKELLEQIDMLISEGNNSYFDLDESDKENLSSTCLTLLGNDAEHCITGGEDFHLVVQHLSKFLRTADADEGFCLLDIIRRNTVNYFSEVLTQLFSERSDEIEYERNIENDFVPYSDPITGELTWRQ